jgi:UDP-N-acetylglucosamine/UDP-N-acetylgalactosamine diphosphorylase
MSSLTVGKASDDEKVGLFVTVAGTLHIVEYSGLPDWMARLRNVDGSRKFDLANIAVHVLDRAFVERIAGDGRLTELPWHGARKAVSYIDLKTGRRISPAAPNAVKAELFVFDALPLAQRTVLLCTERVERFSPVKNAEGVDSVATAQRDMVRRAAAWLEACGVSIPKTPQGWPDCVVEISPLFARDVNMLREHQPGHRRIARADHVLLE